MIPTEKKPFAIRLGIAASVLAIGALVFTVHRHHRATGEDGGSSPAAKNAGEGTISAVSGEDHGKGMDSSGNGKGSGVAAHVPGAPSNPSGTVSGALPGSPATASAPTQPAAPLEGCFTVTYHHKSLASHRDEEACSRHRNLIRLKHARINGGSVCVRVNGTPVKFQRVQGHADEILIGAVAGPQSVITARYCIGKSKCGEDCTVPRDEFMEAIGGAEDDGDGNSPAVAQWDSNDAAEKEAAEATAKLDTELKRELASEDSDGRAGGMYVFQDWLSEADPAVACGPRQARN